MERLHSCRSNASAWLGWFYEGTDIYRHVWLTKTDPLHVAEWGTFVKSTKRIDPTRRTSVASSGSGKGVSVGADVIGLNYGAQHDVDAFHRQFPDKPALMSEEGSTLSTRGIYFDDRDAIHLNAGSAEFNVR